MGLTDGGARVVISSYILRLCKRALRYLWALFTREAHRILTPPYLLYQILYGFKNAWRVLIISLSRVFLRFKYRVARFWRIRKGILSFLYYF